MQEERTGSCSARSLLQVILLARKIFVEDRETNADILTAITPIVSKLSGLAQDDNRIVFTTFKNNVMDNGEVQDHDSAAEEMENVA